MATGSEHEQGLGYFVSREHRKRFRESLANPKRRDDELRRLFHFRHLEMRHATPVKKGREQWTENLLATLRAQGAPDECYCVSNDEDLDGRTVPLEKALRTLLDTQSEAATFVSCIPGRLAYFHDEYPEDRYILSR